MFRVLRAGFRALPVSEATRDVLRQGFFERFPRIRPAVKRGQAWPASEFRARVHAGGRAIGYVERTDEALPDPMPATLAAFYLPHFHAIPENDEWWGNGFTEWRDVARDYVQRPKPEYRLFPGVNCGWDNEPRRPGRGRTFLRASPHGHGRWLRETIRLRVSDVPKTDRIIFINAWNQWAEGAALEPDAKLGHAFLYETRDALHTLPHSNSELPCAVIHAWHAAPFDEVLRMIQRSRLDWRIIVTTFPDQAATVESLHKLRSLDAEIHVFENRERDIAPFHRILPRLALEQRDLIVLKLHIKVSAHFVNGSQWRQDLLSSLLDERRAKSRSAPFITTAISALLPPGHALKIQEYLETTVPT